MVITDIRIKLAHTDDHPNLLAYASFVANGELCVRDCRLIRTDRNQFVQMPCRLRQNKCNSCGRLYSAKKQVCNHCGEDHGYCDGGWYMDIVLPIVPEARDVLERELWAAYEMERAAHKVEVEIEQ